MKMDNFQFVTTVNKDSKETNRIRMNDITQQGGSLFLLLTIYKLHSWNFMVDENANEITLK